MYRIILIALALLVLAFPAAARDRRETGVTGMLFEIYLTADEVEAIANGGDYNGPAKVVMQVGDWGSTEEVPVKYRISWTVNKKWLSWETPNPAHGRRGNLFYDSSGPDTYWEYVDISKISIPAGKTLRARVRSIYADKTRGMDCTIVFPWSTFDKESLFFLDRGVNAGMYMARASNFSAISPGSYC